MYSGGDHGLDEQADRLECPKLLGGTEFICVCASLSTARCAISGHAPPLSPAEYGFASEREDAGAPPAEEAAALD
eukprot:1879783-Pyramimonas_sp.AAC.1